MITQYRIIHDTYQDSVQLMRVASDVSEISGVSNAEALMGTPSNRERLVESAQLTTEELEDVGPDDVLLIAEAPDDHTATEAVEAMASKLHTAESPANETSEMKPQSIRRAAGDMANPQVASISVPGEYATKVAWNALHEGLHVHLFSDNVPLADEKALKTTAQEMDRLVMGPDCGTAIVDGHPFGFANEVSSGSIGLVAASGTGLQAVSSRISRRGGGISQAVGTGGRDLTEHIEAKTTQTALNMLDDDPETDVIVIISKPPSDAAVEAVSASLEDAKTPVIAHFQGTTKNYDNVQMTETLADTADIALEQSGIEPSVTDSRLPDSQLKTAVNSLSAEKRWVRGLFTGGTLCTEAALTLAESGKQIQSNVGIGEPVSDPASPSGHAVLDLGTDDLTAGRPHPMIDLTLRNNLFRQALEDPSVGIIILDVVLGHGAHEDPAGALANVLDTTESDSLVIASVCGTDEDPQHRTSQIETLETAGIFVAESNATAARHVADAISNSTSHPVEGGSQ